MFVSCSNMTIGFEEDSPFYNGPVIDTREDVNATNKTESVVVQDKKEIEVQEEVTTKPIEATKEPKATAKAVEAVEVKTPESQKIQEEESETTFTYERDDE